MGFFWDLLQQSQISNQREHAENLESRVRWLENELNRTQTLLRELILRLENRMGEDLDRDGRVG
ncbi:MAG: hypothetical protein HBSAPP02_00880 [Phycisphaerae bacterium]|nr:MAG: hypothetical protein DCC66_03325 [Planctomycetota bacterium]GJQ25056.1 MAG: hypothetical protein HBSAPP02_00880 [Phycisphaerae bacterium]